MAVLAHRVVLTAVAHAPRQARSVVAVVIHLAVSVVAAVPAVASVAAVAVLPVPVAVAAVAVDANYIEFV